MQTNNRIPAYAGIYYNPQHTSRRPPQWLPQLSLSSVTKLYDVASHTLLTQTFINPSTLNPIASANYTFPLYESSAVVSFRCRIGAQLIEGIIQEKENAQASYQDAINQHEPASLLKQQTPDVFTTSIGNIPPGETVNVEIEYIMELKHDAEVDGLRFTIPTTIAPRYGDLPSGMNPDAISTSVNVEGMDISVEISMPSNISSVQSPSHPISIYLGGHSECTPEDSFNPKHALVTLGQTSTVLDKDFIILVKCPNLSSPSALLETHPTIPNSKALMLTLVPKFNLPESSRPEIVFVVDRSGSMTTRVAPLRSSLSVFLRSLPLDVDFNICSFGSSYSFLWNRSMPYSNESFEEAQRHCDSMEANLGGTEILPAIKATIERRYTDLNLEIMVLTDGQVWNSEDLFNYVKKETIMGDVRLFSLGIGQDVSHALIDGMARVGRGFSQVVSHEREGMESKVARMLRGALSAHVLNYRLEWEGKPEEEEDADVSPQPSSPTLTREIRRINLFDRQADADSPISFSSLPDFVVPSVLQAPHKLQPLFPFSRSIAYAILSSDVQPPSHVWLRGTTPAGDELELEIEVQTVPRMSKTIHQLAARKILQELKDGTGYLHSGKYGVSRERHPERFAELVKTEGVRVGLAYGVVSQWTSFVATLRRPEDVQEEREVDDNTSSGLGDHEEFELIDGDDDNDDDNDDNHGDNGNGGAGANRVEANRPATGSSTARPRPSQPTDWSPLIMMSLPSPPPPIQYPTKSSKSSKFSSLLRGKPAPDKGADSKLFTSASYAKPFSRPAPRKGSTVDASHAYSSLPPAGFPTEPLSFDPSLSLYLKSTSPDTTSLGSESDDTSYMCPPLLMDMSCVEDVKVGDSNKSKTSLESVSKSYDNKWSTKGNKFDTPDFAISYSPANAPPAERLSSETGAQPLSLKARALIGLQTFEGCFELSPALAWLLDVSMADLDAKLSCFVPTNAGVDQENRRKIWATVLAIKLFENQLAADRSVWQLVVDKARAWIRYSGVMEDADVKELEKLAEAILDTV